MDPKQTILVVEDDYQLRPLIAAFLGSICNVMTCTNAEEGIRLIESEKFMFDLVLTDYDCPNPESGGHVIATAHKHLPNASLIIMTGGEYDEEVLRQMHNIDDYLHKPFKPEELISIIGKHLAQ